MKSTSIIFASWLVCACRCVLLQSQPTTAAFVQAQPFTAAAKDNENQERVAVLHASSAHRANPLDTCLLAAIATMTTKPWLWYTVMLSRNPILTKAVTASILMSISDIICQKLAQSFVDNNQESSASSSCSSSSSFDTRITKSGRKEKKHDWKRTLDVAIVGLLWSGPVTHAWYAMLERLVTTIQQPFLGLAARIFLDAAIFTPLTVAFYFMWRTLLEGSGIRGVVEKLQSKWKGAVFGAWRFWPIANIVNFLFVPLPFRVLYATSLSLIWNGYMSNMNSAKQSKMLDRLE